MGAPPTSSSKECTSFSLLTRGDDVEPDLSLPKPCSPSFTATFAAEGEADRDRTGVGPPVLAALLTVELVRKDGRADGGLAGSSGSSCSAMTW